jgi:integrase
MSVRKRTWQTRKGELKEAWIVDYADGAGKRRMKTFKTKKAADAWRNKTGVEIRDGIHTPDSASVTIAEAADLWLKSCAVNRLEPATVDGYEQHCRLHIVPLIGRWKLSQLSAPMVRAFEDRLRKDRSPAMIRRVLTSLSTLVSDAQERGLVARNVCKDLRARRRPASHEERHKGKLKAGVLTATFTGLRASELRGLRWEDVDFERRELHVRNRVDKRNRSGAPKTASSHRTVPLAPIVVNTLKEHKLACPSWDFVFPTANGKPEYHANNLLHIRVQPVAHTATKLLTIIF